jgi:tetratricopeptide (TPR) repeat protein
VCLEQQVLRFSALVDRLAEADLAIVGEPGGLAWILPDLGRCAHADALRGPDWPDDPVTRARFTALWTELAQLASFVTAGTNLVHTKRAHEAGDRIDAALREARALGDRGAEATASYIAGSVANADGDRKRAKELLHTALWTAEAAGDDELVADAAADLVFSLNGSPGHDDELRDLRELARAAAERVGSPGVRAGVARSIASADIRAGRRAQAQAELAEATKLLEQIYGPDHPGLATVLSQQASLANDQGRPAAAEALQRRALEIEETKLGPDHPNVAGSLNGIANYVFNQGRYDEAAKLFNQAVAAAERARGPDHTDVAVALEGRGTLKVRVGDLKSARDDLERALAIIERHKSRELTRVRGILASVVAMEGKLPEAIAMEQQTVAIARAQFGDHSPMTTEHLLGLAGWQLASGQVPASRETCDEAARSLSGTEADNANLVAAVATCHAEIELAVGHPEKARRFLEPLLKPDTAPLEPDTLGPAQFALARALPRSQSQRARELALAARKVFADAGNLMLEDREQVDRWLAAHAAAK